MSACSIKVRGVVQGVGFRPFVFRLARANLLAGWVFNGEGGVEIFVEGSDQNLETFVQKLKAEPPPAARIAEIEIRSTEPTGLSNFTIRESHRDGRPTTHISPDLAVCDDCLKELFDPADRRYLYPYINCTNCGPRYSVTLKLPYDRQNTTMREWELDEFCAHQYDDPADRRFHAQPVACAECGAGYYLRFGDEIIRGNQASIGKAVELLAGGKIVAVKGLGGYHLACDAKNAAAVQALRDRKYRKEKPFALMVRNADVACEIVDLSFDGEEALRSPSRPIVLAPGKMDFPGVAPGSSELGVMLPSTPLHHLLFAAGAPEILVMTSANRSSEPIAYEDDDALERLVGIADAFLIGERPIARRVDDSVSRDGVFGFSMVRRARGFAPGSVASIPSNRTILAVGADLKNAIAVVVDGQAFISQHIGDLDHFASLRAFEETIDDLILMYEVDRENLLIVHDCHPGYASSARAAELHGAETRAIQHHRAHIASVLAEHQAWDVPVIGVSFDGTGYGDDGTIWGGEIFAGRVCEGFERVAHIRRAALPGGDAAAHHPVQAAAGFLSQVRGLPDLFAAPFHFPSRYTDALKLVGKNVRTFTTTSAGRLFDTAAALLGFTHEMTYEGQAAMWLEQLARSAGSAPAKPYEFPFVGGELDYRPLLRSVAQDRARGRDIAEIARAFHRGVAQGLANAAIILCRARKVKTIVLSGGVFQNELLLEDLKSLVDPTAFRIWTNHAVPANDGGISLGQAALAAFDRFDVPCAGGPVETAV
jgi:hydrogenase maturation protein HypF